MTARGSGFLRIYDRLNERTALQFVDYVLEKLPFRVEVIQTATDARSSSTYWVMSGPFDSSTWITPTSTACTQPY